MRRTAGCLLGVLGVVVGLAAVLIGGDIAARHYATSRIEQRIRADAPTAREVHGHIHSWPFLQVGLNGHVDEMGARIGSVKSGPLLFTNLDVEIHRIRISTSGLISGHVTVNSIGEGTVTADLPLPAILVQLKLPDVSALSVIADGPSRTLVVKVAGLQVARLPLPSADLFPCVPAVGVHPDRLSLACAFTRVPAAFTTVSS